MSKLATQETSWETSNVNYGSFGWTEVAHTSHHGYKDAESDTPGIIIGYAILD